jgi:tRNA (pseudouridine54-N1)-methyltransferase
MRQFVVVGHDAPTDADFSLDNLPGAGRLDLLARCVTAALLRSHGIREDVQVHLVLGDEFTLRFDGATLQGLNPDERSTAARIRDALDQRREAVGRMAVETSPGLFLRRGGLAATLDDIEGPIFQLHGAGTPVVDIEPPANPVFVCSDHREFQPADEQALAEVRDGRLALGPEALHADQAITVAHNWLDTGGFAEY